MLKFKLKEKRFITGLQKAESFGVFFLFLFRIEFYLPKSNSRFLNL